uniref:Uncharacterized protein n=1 Tax=Utricularia reniformis TaxID=192314 RepID=A0A1Y0B3Y4_9LAMI|nr:hypothetical protein AEK19_MT1946 [Utricularia reniformis]ART32110.1 hypothetical protein AEK19_MT1946 [Utricularia reniformis]
MLRYLLVVLLAFLYSIDHYSIQLSTLSHKQCLHLAVILRKQRKNGMIHILSFETNECNVSETSRKG